MSGCPAASSWRPATSCATHMQVGLMRWGGAQRLGGLMRWVWAPPRQAACPDEHLWPLAFALANACDLL